ncbi:MAG: trigger factor [Lachnospiraceae bacterium]|nr:trigger factor [Lachnospiraceae bacterium]
MKKKLLAIVLAVASACALVACGDTSDLVYLKDFTASKYAQPGEYMGVELSVSEPTVTDAQVEDYINGQLAYGATFVPVTDRTDVQVGDTVNLDYEGKLDGVAFDGGTAQGASLTIGSGQFIDGFEDGMVGMEIGETRDVEATFPDPYLNNPDLAGKVAVFTVTVNSISVEQPAELNDEFVAGRGLEGVSTVAEYKEYIYEQLLAQAQNQFETERVEAAIDIVQEASDFKKLPTGMTDRLYNVLYSNMQAYAQMFGIEVSEYVAMVYGIEAEQAEEEMRNQTELMAQRYVLMASIAEKEGITVTDEELEAAFAEEAAAYGYSDVEAYKAAIDTESYKEYVLYKKVGTMIADNAVLAGASAE